MERAKKIEETMRLVWDSLDSHLPYTYENQLCKKCVKDIGDTHAFHKKCVKEYLKIMSNLGELY